MKIAQRKEIASVCMIKIMLLKSAVCVAFVIRGKNKLMRDDNINDLITNLKSAIDKLDQSFKDVKEQVLELAIALDVFKKCDRSDISKQIKHLLEDYIKKGKITARWIEESLPDEYKRKYTKSEASSLSKNNKRETAVVTGESGNIQTLISQISNESSSNNDENVKSPQNPYTEELRARDEDNASNSSSNDLNRSKSSNFVDFEFSLEVEDVRRYMAPMYFSGPQRAWFNGKVDKETGKVIAVYLGKISERKKFADEEGKEE
jgi:hypothetical protein